MHRLANIRAKLPDASAAEVIAHVYAVRDAPTLDAARAAADRLINTYRRESPAAVGCFQDDLDALLAIHRVPVRHRIRVRTTDERVKWQLGANVADVICAGRSCLIFTGPEPGSRHPIAFCLKPQLVDH